MRLVSGRIYGYHSVSCSDLIPAVLHCGWFLVLFWLSPILARRLGYRMSLRLPYEEPTTRITRITRNCRYPTCPTFSQPHVEVRHTHLIVGLPAIYIPTSMVPVSSPRFHVKTILETRKAGELRCHIYL